MYRNHNCSELKATHSNKEVMLACWGQSKGDLFESIVKARKASTIVEASNKLLLDFIII